jgi:hypothetical protein
MKKHYFSCRIKFPSAITTKNKQKCFKRNKEHQKSVIWYPSVASRIYRQSCCLVANPIPSYWYSFSVMSYSAHVSSNHRFPRWPKNTSWVVTPKFSLSTIGWLRSGIVWRLPMFTRLPIYKHDCSLPQSPTSSHRPISNTYHVYQSSPSSVVSWYPYR